MTIISKLICFLEDLTESRDVRNFYQHATGSISQSGPKISPEAPKSKLVNWPEMEILRDQVIMPRLRKERLGRFAYLPIDLIIPDEKFEHRLSVLDMFEAGDDVLRGRFRDTGYFQDQLKRSDEKKALLKLFRYRQLYNSIKNHGFRFDPEEMTGLPFIFIANNPEDTTATTSLERDFVARIDGTHRASVARYLGYRELPVQVIQPEDLLGLSTLPDEIRVYLERLQPYHGDVVDFVPINQNRVSIEKAVREMSNWYQDIEFLPRIRTLTPEPSSFKKIKRTIFRPEQPLKNEALMSALPDLTGKHVLDVGCNAGMHSLHARWRGAESVLGIDLEQKRIDQANLTKELFSGLGYRTDNTEFRRANLMEDFEILEGIDTIMACCMLYHVGPVDALKQAIRASDVNLFLFQCNTVRGNKIGKKNRPGHWAYEEHNKTWGNVLGTIEGGKQFLSDIGFTVRKITMPHKQFPTLVAVRD